MLSVGIVPIPQRAQNIMPIFYLYQGGKLYKDHLTFKASEDKFDDQFEDYYPRLNVESRKNVPNISLNKLK